MKKIVLKCLITGLMVSVLNTSTVAFANEVKSEIVGAKTISENSKENISKERVVEFKDENLKFGIISELNINIDNPVTVEMLEGITELDLSGYQVYDLTPLQYCINLEKVDLSNNESLLTFHPLNNLPKLKELKACNTYFWNLNQISNLKNLEILDLEGTEISDLSQISQLTNLKSLNLNYCKKLSLEEINFIGELKNLEELSLVDNYIYDASFLKGCKNLKKIDLSKNYLSNLAVFKELIDNGNLKDLNLEEQSITLDYNLMKKDFVITIPIEVLGIKDNNLEISNLNDGITYLKDSYSFQVDIKNYINEDFNYEFKDTSFFEGINYKFDGIIHQFIYFEETNNEDIEEETNTTNKPEDKTQNENNPSNKNTTNKSNTSSTPKTADPGMLGALGVLTTSLSVMLVLKKKK